MLQRLTPITIFLPPNWYMTRSFQGNVFHKPEALLWSCDPSGAQNVCINENLDDKNGKRQLGTRMIGMPLSMEKLDTCLQQFAVADDRAKIPELNMLALADCGSALPFCKRSQDLGMSEAWRITRSASHFDHSAELTPSCLGVTGSSKGHCTASWERCGRWTSERFPNVFRICQVFATCMWVSHALSRSPTVDT